MEKVHGTDLGVEGGTGGQDCIGLRRRTALGKRRAFLSHSSLLVLFCTIDLHDHRVAFFPSANRLWRRFYHNYPGIRLHSDPARSAVNIPDATNNGLLARRRDTQLIRF